MTYNSATSFGAQFLWPLIMKITVIGKELIDDECVVKFFAVLLNDQRR